MRWLPLALLLALPVRGEVVLEDEFETLDTTRWKLSEAARDHVAIVDGGVRGKCLRVIGVAGKTVYLTLTLDPQRFRGERLTVSAMVKLENGAAVGETFFTPKFHFGFRREGDNAAGNAAERWTGSFDWTEKSLTLDVPDNCVALNLDIGNQNGTGTVWFDNLKLTDSVGLSKRLDLLPVCNSGRSDGVAGDGRGSFLDLGPLDLYHLPDGELATPRGSFFIPAPGTNGGQTAILLKGARRPNLPAATEPLPVGARLKELLLLHAAWGAADGEEVYRLEVAFEDGRSEQLTLVAGRDLGNFDEPRPLPAAEPAWRGTCAAGRPVGVWTGVWTNPRPEVAVASFRFVSAGHGVPIILAASYTTPRGAN